MNRSIWEEEAKQEIQAAVDEAWEASNDQGQRTRAFREIVRDAAQAQRIWAWDLIDEFEQRGAAAFLKAERKASTQVLVSHDGKLLSKPRTIGVTRVDAAGKKYSEQTLFDYEPWESLVAKRSEYVKQMDSYGENVAMIDRLLELQELAPGADCPIAACTELGTTIEDWLGEEKSA